MLFWIVISMMSSKCGFKTQIFNTSRDILSDDIHEHKERYFSTGYLNLFQYDMNAFFTTTLMMSVTCY